MNITDRILVVDGEHTSRIIEWLAKQQNLSETNYSIRLNMKKILNYIYYRTLKYEFGINVLSIVDETTILGNTTLESYYQLHIKKCEELNGWLICRDIVRMLDNMKYDNILNDKQIEHKLYLDVVLINKNIHIHVSIEE